MFGVLCITGVRESQGGRWPACGRLLDVDVGADERVVQEEDLALLGFEDLPLFPVHGLNERLTED